MRPLDLIVRRKYALIGIIESPREEDYREALDLACRLDRAACRSSLMELCLAQGPKYSATE